MSQSTEKLEEALLQYAFIDPQTIDRAIQAGVSPAHFVHPFQHHLWRLLCELRMAGKSTDSAAVIQEAIGRGVLEQMGGLPAMLQAGGIDAIGPGGSGPCIDALISLRNRRESYKLLHNAVKQLEDGPVDLEAVGQLVEKAQGHLSGFRSVQRGIGDIADEALKDAKEQISGQAPSRVQITTGLPMFDRYATPMEMNDYVVVGGRTSAGKSSLMIQIAGHNLSKGRRVVIFSLETSDTMVLTQLVGQRAGVNVRRLSDEMPAKQQDYIAKMDFAKTSKNLLIFDRDISLTSIQARCRLLAQSFKPDLVIIDYLNIIGTDGDAYQKTTRVSNAMIELRKQLGCCLMVGAQLNRSSEKEEREPNRTDLRDSGSIEQDASRILAIWRKPGQAMDQDWYDCSLLQLKNRTGPLANMNCRFHATHTKFVETA